MAESKPRKKTSFAVDEIPNPIEEESIGDSNAKSTSDEPGTVNEDAVLDSYTETHGRRETQAFIMSHLPSHRNVLQSVEGPRRRSLSRGVTFHGTLQESMGMMGSGSYQAAASPDYSATLPARLLPVRAKKSLFKITKDLCAKDEVDKIRSSSDEDSSQAGLLRDREKRQSIFDSTERHKSVAFRTRLKSVTVSIAEKKVLWESYTDFDPSLVAGAAWRGWERRKAQFADVFKTLDIWTSHFKEIEGRFGGATASYFRFTRWLVFLNFFTFLCTMLVIVVPFFATTEPSKYSDNMQPAGVNNTFLAYAVNCSTTYEKTLDDFVSTEETQQKVLDFFIGTGWMEHTNMFYGHYYNRTFHAEDDDSGYNYNMGLAYIMTIGITFILSFILILLNSSHSVKDTVMDNQEQSSVHFTNSVLCGWDYCIFDERTAKNKKNILLQEFKGDLLEQIKRIQRLNRTNRQKLVLFVLRVAVNFVVVSILAGALFLIYFTTDKLLELRQKNFGEAIQLLIQFLPSLTIVFLNFIIPNFFNSLVKIEDYRPTFQLKITLIRTVLLRLSSLGVLTASLYFSLLTTSSSKESYDCPEQGMNGTKCCGNFLWETPSAAQNASVKCWETYVGQQFYKLAIADFVALIFLTFFVEFPRKLIFDHFKDKFELVNKFGRQEFDIPQNVLDIVYSQTLSWLGTYFAPLLPAMTLIKVVFIFYIKKLTLMRNHAPPQHVYKVSKSNSFFNLILLISFVLVAIIIGYMIGNIHPSMSCGPFRLYSKEDYLTWTALTDVISGWPSWASTLFFFFGSTAFFVPCFFVLCLLMYYYWAVGQGYKRMDEILQEQLKLEGKDKQFLLARVNDIIRQGNLQGVTSTIN